MGSFASTRKKRDETPTRIIEVTSPSDTEEPDQKHPSKFNSNPISSPSKTSPVRNTNGKRTRKQASSSQQEHVVVGPNAGASDATRMAVSSSIASTTPRERLVSPRHSSFGASSSAYLSIGGESSARDCTVLFEWSYMEAQEVSIAGTFSDWEPIEMSWNQEEKVFQICLNIFAGCHMFRYIVDGEVRIDPRIDFSDYEDGHPANIVTFQPDNSTGNASQAGESAVSRRSSSGIRISSVTSIGADTSMSYYDDDNSQESWGQEEREFNIDKKNPPILPPHISYTPLNYPTLRNTRKAMETVEDAIEMPMHVTLQHLYVNDAYDNVNQVGISARYKKKWITVEFFGPKDKRKTQGSSER